MKIILIALTLFVTISSCSRKPQNGYELIEQMYNTNKSNWYETLCFSQDVIRYSNDSIIATEVRREAVRPGNHLYWYD